MRGCAVVVEVEGSRGEFFPHLSFNPPEGPLFKPRPTDVTAEQNCHRIFFIIFLPHLTRNVVDRGGNDENVVPAKERETCVDKPHVKHTICSQG